VPMRPRAPLCSAQISSVIVAGELQPQAMLTTLSTKFGLGQRLSRLLVSCYGGHLHRVAIALGRLAVLKERCR
jgi:hypothetical protein